MRREFSQLRLGLHYGTVGRQLAVGVSFKEKTGAYNYDKWSTEVWVYMCVYVCVCGEQARACCVRVRVVCSSVCLCACSMMMGISDWRWKRVSTRSACAL